MDVHLMAMSGKAQTAQAVDAPSPRLVRAAHQFEGMIMNELLKPITNGDALAGADEDSDSGAGSGGALSDFATETLGQSLSERGGLGIANRIIQKLSHIGNQGGGGKVTQNLHQNHGIRAHE